MVKLFSDEYFKLLREHPDFAKAQKLGWAMSVNVGDQRIVVEKDGKQKSEELLKRSQGQPRINQAPNQFQEQLQRLRGLNKFNVLPRNGQQQLRQLQNQIDVDPAAQNRNEALRRGNQP